MKVNKNLLKISERIRRWRGTADYMIVLRAILIISHYIILTRNSMNRSVFQKLAYDSNKQGNEPKMIEQFTSSTDH